MRSGPRVVAGVLLGVLLAQAAWILAVPPFRGMDEFDHAFRASGVASGQWRLTEAAAAGRGLLVDVPSEFVEASEAQCASLPYIESDTCDGDGPGPDGTVRATTSAGGYPPVYYWVVGTAGEPFTGATSLYAMRIASALMCALLLAAGAWCLSTWTRGPWSWIGLLVGLSPTLLYTTTVVAPNGLEMSAGVCLWAALLGLGAGAAPDPAGLRRERHLLVAAVVAAVPLAGLRSLGPLWVLLIVGCVVALRGPRPILAVVGRHRALVALGTVLVAGAVLAVLWWNHGGVTVPKGALNDDVDSSWGQVVRWPTWILGSIGAFPYRDQPAPLVVHLLVLLVLVTMLVAVVRHGSGQGRGALLLALGLCLLVPSALVAITLEERGGIWQGRYSLPFVAGVMILAGLVLDRVRWRTDPRDVRPQALAVVMLGVAHVVSVVHVQRAELLREVSVNDTGWAHPPTPVTGLLMVLAWVALGVVALSQRQAAETPDGDPSENVSAGTT